MVEEGLLEGGKDAVGGGEPLDGDDLGCVEGHGQQQAAVGAPAVDEDGAGSALPVVAALLGSGQVQLLPQGVEEGDAVVQVEDVGPAVDAELDARADRAGRGRWGGLLLSQGIAFTCSAFTCSHDRPPCPITGSMP